MKVLVTGGAGFIGSAVVRRLVLQTHHTVMNVDKLTYAGCLESLSAVKGHPRYQFIQADIAEATTVRNIFADWVPDYVLHLAAESHVDRSIDGPAAFLHTNITGTAVLLEASLAYWRELSADRKAGFRFQHISTDEVFGSLGGADPAFTEQSRYAPNSPYAASKASADHLVRAWSHTYGLPAVTTNCSNNYGPFQFPEKLIPLVIEKCLQGEPIPVYGQGTNIRDWLYVEDHVDALLRVMERGVTGETYNIGGRCELANIDLLHRLCAVLDQALPQHAARPFTSLITFVTDRPAHDHRYAIDCTKIEDELGWRPGVDIDTGLRQTVKWYLENRAWCEAASGAKYSGERLGLAK